VGGHRKMEMVITHKFSPKLGEDQLGRKMEKHFRPKHFRPNPRQVEPYVARRRLANTTRNTTCCSTTAELMMMPKKIAAAALLSALAAPVEAGYEGAMTCGSAYSGTTTGGSSFHNEDGFSGFDAVWTLTLTEETTVTVAACQTDHSPNAPADANQADWVMRMYNLNLADGCVAADTCHIYTELGYEDDDSCGLQETRTFTAPAGEYIYVLDGLSPSVTGPFYVEVTCTTPDNPPVVPIAFVAANNCFGVELDATLARGDCPALTPPPAGARAHSTPVCASGYGNLVGSTPSASCGTSTRIAALLCTHFC
jgi:hypothetical protein